MDYVPAGGGERVPAFADVAQFDIPPINGVGDHVAFLDGLLTGYFTNGGPALLGGDGGTWWDPVILDPLATPLHPADAQSTRYQLIVVGPGYGEGALQSLDDAMKAKRTKLVQWQFVMDFILPFIGNVVLPVGGESMEKFLGWAEDDVTLLGDIYSMVTADAPAIDAAIAASDWVGAFVLCWRSWLGTDSVKNAIFDTLREWTEETDGKDAAVAFAGGVEKVMAVLSKIDIGFAALDLALQANCWRLSNGADSWQIDITPAQVQMTPDEAQVPIERVLPITQPPLKLTAAVSEFTGTGSRQGAVLYRWKVAEGPGLIRGFGHAESQGFDSSRDTIEFIPTEPGYAKVTCEAFFKVGTELTPLGMDTSTLQVTSVEIQPKDLHITTNEHPVLGAVVQMAPKPYRFEWKTDGRGGLRLADGDPWQFRLTVAEGNPRLGRRDGTTIAIVVRLFAYHDAPGDEPDYLIGSDNVIVSTDLYHVPATLTGWVERYPEIPAMEWAYGVAFAKVPEAINYGIRGSGFNDPLLYGTEYHGTWPDHPPSRLDRDWGDSLFKWLASGSANHIQDRTDEEIFAEDAAWRFAGGSFHAFPGFF